MSVTIIGDSACDMTQEEAARRGIVLLPLKTIIDGEEYLDGVTITHEEFYQRLETCRELPSTSQVSPAAFADAFQEAVADGGEAVAVTLSGGLSGTVQSARIAAADYPGRVWVVDSENVTAGERILLEYAVILRDRGLSAGEIAQRLDRVKKRICLLAQFDTVKYLMKGGRLSRAAALGCSVLNIKPIVTVVGGEAKLIGKGRGVKHSRALLTGFIHKHGGIDFSMPFALAYTGGDDSLIREYAEENRDLWADHVDALPYYRVGSTIGAHAGPGAIAVAFFTQKEV